MTLTVVGVSHRTAPIEVRERFHVGPERTEAFLRAVTREEGVEESVVLSTCNRTECYLYGEEDACAEVARREMARRAGVTRSEAGEYFTLLHGREAAVHLVRVVAGLDSLVIGEPQIQGQVSEAYRTARGGTGEPVGAVLHRLFQTALSAGGDVRDATRIGEGAASVPAAAVALVEKIFGTLEGRRALVVGAGEMGELTLRSLLDRGVAEARVASRTLERASEMAASLPGARPLPFEEFRVRLPAADVVVTSTSAPHSLITAEELGPRLRGRHDPLVIVDIALPRDVEPEVGELPGVFLYNIDDLQRVVEDTARRRRAETEDTERLVAERAEEFWRWLGGREAVPLIRGFRERAERVRRREIEGALEEVDGLSEEGRERIRKASRQLLGEVLHPPTVGLRRLAREESGEVLDLARRLFGLPEEGGEDPPAPGEGEETEDSEERRGHG